MVSKEAWYRELEAHYVDRMPGGLADNAKPEDFEPAQLHKGIRTEMEHTGDPELAQEIAMDHLTEDPKYYDRLELIEARVAGEEMPESGSEESSPWVPKNPQAFYYWVKWELQDVVETGHPANIGGKQVSPEYAQRALQFLNSAPIQTAYHWISKVFPPQFDRYYDRLELIED